MTGGETEGRARERGPESTPAPEAEAPGVGGGEGHAHPERAREGRESWAAAAAADLGGGGHADLRDSCVLKQAEGLLLLDLRARGVFGRRRDRWAFPELGVGSSWGAAQQSMGARETDRDKATLVTPLAAEEDETRRATAPRDMDTETTGAPGRGRSRRSETLCRERAGRRARERKKREEERTGQKRRKEGPAGPPGAGIGGSGPHRPQGRLRRERGAEREPGVQPPASAPARPGPLPTPTPGGAAAQPLAVTPEASTQPGPRRGPRTCPLGDLSKSPPRPGLGFIACRWGDNSVCLTGWL